MIWPFLQVEEKVPYDWPQLSFSALLVLAVAVAGVYLVLKVAKVRNKKRQQLDKRWQTFLPYFQQKGLNWQQIHALHEFYDSLSFLRRSKVDFRKPDTQLLNALHSHFSHYEDQTADASIIMLQMLLTGSVSNEPHDPAFGEFAVFEIDGYHIPVLSEGIRDGRLVLRYKSPHIYPEKDIQGRLNVFLPERGWFVTGFTGRSDRNRQITGTTDEYQPDEEKTREYMQSRKKKKRVAGADEIPEILAGSLQQIISYAKLPEADADSLKRAVVHFRELNFRMNPGFFTPQRVKHLEKIFLSLYHRVFKSYTAGHTAPPAVKMFLLYSYLDEALLTPLQLNVLKDSLEKETPELKYFRIFAMPVWLQAVQKLKMNPSVTPVGQSFESLEKRNKLPRAVTRLEDRHEKALAFELFSMFRNSHRMTTEHPAVYFPFLHLEEIPDNASDSITGPGEIERELRAVMALDRTVFHREMQFSDPEKGVELQRVVRYIPPDFIIIPNAGVRGIVWQELNGNRQSRGRLLVPALSSRKLRELMILLLGRYRWELTRSLESKFWNDPAGQSLTAEYYNYLENYRKNRDLSTEAKERISVLLGKYRKNYRELFAHDYYLWLIYESKGHIRLNKVVRSIMAKYVPLPEKIREDLLKNPVYQQAFVRFNNMKHKRVHDLEIFISARQKEGYSVPKEIHETCEFYKNL